MTNSKFGRKIQVLGMKKICHTVATCRVTNERRTICTRNGLLHYSIHNTMLQNAREPVFLSDAFERGGGNRTATGVPLIKKFFFF